MRIFQPSLRLMAMTTTNEIPPISPYGTLEGTLFQYMRNLAAFESDGSSPNKCILIGGLSDGLIPLPYTGALDVACREAGWSLVQPVMSSSYLGFGNGDLERDSKEISQLMFYLKCHRSAEKFVIVGHSTGCQNSIHFLKHGNPDMISMTKGVVLQAPASDRENAMREPGYESNLEHARKLKQQGQEMEMMPRSAFWAPITAKRFLDLKDFGGADDFFSSDFSDEQMIERLSHVGKLSSTLQALLVAYSGSDEYVPKEIDTKLLAHRLCDAMNDACNESGEVARPLYIETGNHNLSKGPGDSDKLVEEIKKMLIELC